MITAQTAALVVGRQWLYRIMASLNSGCYSRPCIVSLQMLKMGDRFNKAPWCANLKEMIVQGIAPGDCPYITELEGYKPSIDLNDTEYKDLLPFLKLGLKSGDTSPIDKKDLDKFLDS